MQYNIYFERVWNVVFEKENLHIFENKVTREISGPKVHEVIKDLYICIFSLFNNVLSLTRTT
jgi:hypothetical protein